ncbi:MAG: radical SAM protein [Candidatus Pacearchaeota archaeon]
MGFRFKEGSYYKKIADKKIHCLLCPHSCIIGNGEAGICKVRQNINGNLKSMNYGKVHTSIYEKIEDAGMFHFLPNSDSLSLSLPGTLLKSDFFEKPFDNEELENIPSMIRTPSQIIKQIKKTGTKIIIYKGEPIIFYEYLEDVAVTGKKEKHVVETSGYINKPAAKALSEKIHGVSITIRTMNAEHYKELWNGDLDLVLDTIKTFYDAGVWVEIKMMLIPDVNDSLYGVRRLISWMLSNLSNSVPLHLLAYFPKDGFREPTSPELLKKARKIALDAGLDYVYISNTSLIEENTTFCPNCKKPAIVRDKEGVHNFLSEGKCSCGKEISGVWG